MRRIAATAITATTLALTLTTLAGQVHGDAARNQPARVESHIAKRGYEWKRSGWTADAYLLAPQAGSKGRWVYKRIKPTISEAQLMQVEDARTRGFFRDMTLFVIGELQRAPEFALFAHLVPETKASGRFGILQREGMGMSVKELTAPAAETARRQVDGVRAAAQRALPGVEIDVNYGNILFDEQGNATSFYDPAGGWWARTLGDSLQGRWRGFQADKKRGPFRVGQSVAMRVTGGDLNFGDAWLVVNASNKNPAGQHAHLVKHGFKMAYESTHPLSGSRPLYEVLGAPKNDEQQVSPGVVVQHFEHGHMTWAAATGVQVALTP